MAFSLIKTSTMVLADEIIGKAFKNNKLIYTEKHNAKILSNKKYEEIETSYRGIDDIEFAHIKSNFKKNDFVPDVFFQDLRNNSQEKIAFDENKHEIQIERSSGLVVTKKQLPLFSNSILGQGFHNYIVSHFDQLLANNDNSPQRVSFIITNPADQFNFSIMLDKKNDEYAWINVKPSNIFISAFVPTINLCYERKSMRLKTFKGLSNIEDKDGKSQEVVIEYQYIN